MIKVSEITTGVVGILVSAMSAFGNLILLVGVAIAAFVMFLVVCPYVDQIGHKGLCYVGYGILILTLLYARGSTRGKPQFRQKP